MTNFNDLPIVNRENFINPSWCMNFNDCNKYAGELDSMFTVQCIFNKKLKRMVGTEISRYFEVLQKNYRLHSRMSCFSVGISIKPEKQKRRKFTGQ